MKPTTTIVDAPGGLPVLGHAWPLLRNPLAYLEALTAHSGLVRVRVGPLSALIVCDPELTHQLLVHDRAFDKGGLLLDRVREVFGNGLGTCPHSEQRRQRRLVRPAFDRQRLPGYTRAMTGAIRTVTDSWDNGETIDVLKAAQTMSTRALVAAMFPRLPDGIPVANLLRDLDVISKGIYKRMWMPPLLAQLPIAGNRGFDEARTQLRLAVGQIIDDHRADGGAGDDLLSVLVTPAASHPPTDAEVIDQVMTFFLAGTETVAATLAWALQSLAENPGIEARMYAEIDHVLNGRAASYDDLADLPFTNQVMIETLRLYPPGWLLSRTATVDSQLGEHPIKAGTTVFYSPYLIHRRADLYAEPQRFDPDRWDRQTGSGPPPGGLIPFGGGARRCIGDAFGVTEAVLTLATIATRWRLVPAPGSRVRPSLGLVLNPAKLLMIAKARSAGSP